METEKIENTVTKIRKILTNNFPESFISVSYSDRMCKTIDLRFALGKDRSEWINRCIENDPLNHLAVIHFNADGTFELHWLLYGLTIKPSNPIYHSQTLKLGHRNIKKGTIDKVLANIENYFNRLPEAIKANMNNVLDSDKELFAKKGF